MWWKCLRCEYIVVGMSHYLAIVFCIILLPGRHWKYGKGNGRRKHWHMCISWVHLDWTPNLNTKNRDSWPQASVPRRTKCIASARTREDCFKGKRGKRKIFYDFLEYFVKKFLQSDNWLIMQIPILGKEMTLIFAMKRPTCRFATFIINTLNIPIPYMQKGGVKFIFTKYIRVGYRMKSPG